MNRSGFLIVMALCLLVTMLSMTDATFYVRRYCLVSLRLRTSTYTEMRNVPDFFVSALYGNCPTIRSECFSRVKGHVQSIYGSETNPITGTTAQNFCRLFNTTLTAANQAIVEIKYIADKCSTEQYMSLGSLCCAPYPVPNTVVFLPSTC